MSNTVEPPLLVVIVAGPTALLPKNFSVPELAMSIGALPLLMMPPWLVAPIFENFRDWPPAMPKLYAGAVELKFQRLTTVLAAENVSYFCRSRQKRLCRSARARCWGPSWLTDCS